MYWIFCICIQLFLTTVLANDDIYDIGVGIADITGPSAEIEFWGYGTLKQPGGGIHTRIFSRAFIIGDGEKHVVLVTADLGSMSHIIRLEVLRRLSVTYGTLYTDKNVCLAATHTHSGPGGFHQYTLYSIASGSFSAQNFQTIVDGIVKSIDRAHHSIRKGRIFWNSGILNSVNYNRSPRAYNKNPTLERHMYEFDVNKLMQIIKMVDLHGNPMGMINWYAVHPTSMNNTNLLVSGDNKGYAELKFEESINYEKLLGKGPFVSAFPQESHGDTSPNTLGPRCIDSGEICDIHYLNCNGDVRKCVALGPGKDMVHSAQIIGNRLKNKAMDLFNTSTELIRGKIDSIHQYYSIVGVEIHDYPDKVKTCKPAMGINFGLGTTDGAGENLNIGAVSSSKEQRKCHFPKQILFNTGEMKNSWQPEILPTQIIKIGNVVILPVPAEFTTMAGRRLKKAIEEIVLKNSSYPTYVIVQSLSNDYSSYVTTFEEYQENIYEGASTAYGPHTLEAYIQQYRHLAEKLELNEKVENGPAPPNDLEKLMKSKRKIPADNPQNGTDFGDVLQEPNEMYKVGETVVATFVSGNPRNDLKIESTYLRIDRQNGIESDWDFIATDANWETKFYWKQTNKKNGESEVTITWDIPIDALPGNYRIHHFGSWRNSTDYVTSYSGSTRSFVVAN